MNWLELLVQLLAMPLLAFFIGLAMVLMMRRVAARLQRRIGPPWFQPLIDIVKLFGKKTQTSHGVMHEIGIVVGIGAYIAAETLLPVPGMDGIASKGGIITLSYFLMIPSLGLALGVGQCANPNGSIGISRALTSMLAYDIPFVVVIFGVAWFYGTTNLAEIIRIQQAGGPTAHLSVETNFPPLRMFVRGDVVESGRKIDRRVDVDLLACVELRPQQVEIKMWMHLPHRGRVVAPAVVTLGKKRDRIDVCLLQRALPMLLVETCTDARDFR